MASDLGLFELLVLMAAAAHGDQAYGVVIRRDVAASRGTDVSSGAVYTTLERLERRGLLSSRQGDPSEVRGGRPRRYYRLTRAGRAAIDTNYSAVARLAVRLKPGMSRS